MSVPRELTYAQHAAADLERAVALLAERYGETLELRRLRSDVRRLREDLADLGERPAPAPRQPIPPAEREVVPDAEYTPLMWAGAEDEGLGSPH